VIIFASISPVLWPAPADFPISSALTPVPALLLPIVYLPYIPQGCCTGTAGPSHFVPPPRSSPSFSMSKIRARLTCRAGYTPCLYYPPAVSSLPPLSGLGIVLFAFVLPLPWAEVSYTFVLA
jgi:hypothetical protein